MTLHLTEALRGSVDLVAEAKQRIGDCIDLHDNDDAYSRRVAIAAYEAGRAAYWTRAGYHSQKACELQIAANQMALDRALPFAYNPGADFIAALDTLIPLNAKAAVDLSRQYAEYGLWRTEEELLVRRLRKRQPEPTHDGDAYGGRFLP